MLYPQEYSEKYRIVLGKLRRGGVDVLHLNGEGKSLVELCSQASFGELHALVDELHRRRKQAGTSLEDFPAQEQLKALIRLVHLYGDRQVPQSGQAKVNGGLVDTLKNASRKLGALEPTGLLRELLGTIVLSWPDLLALFGMLLTQPGVDQVLGFELPLAKNYLQFNRLLYLFFARRVIQLHRHKQHPKQYVLSDGELQALVRGRAGLEELYQLVHSKQTEGWAERVPLLPLEANHWLLSPELVYDELLQNYVELVEKLPK